MYPREHNVTGHGLNPDHLMQSQVRTLIITPLFLQDSIFSPEYDKNFNRVYSTWMLGLFILVAPSNDRFGSDAGTDPPISML